VLIEETDIKCVVYYIFDFMHERILLRRLELLFWYQLLSFLTFVNVNVFSFLFVKLYHGLKFADHCMTTWLIVS
jgi:hypothetical protein